MDVIKTSVATPTVVGEEVQETANADDIMVSRDIMASRHIIGVVTRVDPRMIVGHALSFILVGAAGP
ncbi:MAG: hypothetical protein HKN47_27725 [Pirellulaceae bacterium]|nr:hypothetical protein [Pirellulaceae bacterium]